MTKGSKKADIEREDLAIQSTLQMTAEERIELLAALIVDKISEDIEQDFALLKQLPGVSES